MVEGIGRRLDKYQDEPAVASVAAKELAGTSNPEPLRTAYSFGVQSLVAAGDHCFALDRVLRPSAHSHAPWTLARGVLEGSSAAKWLLDPSLEVHTRLARSMSRRLSSLREQQKFLEGMARRPELPGSDSLVRDISHTEDRIEAVISQAEELGVPEKRSKDGKLLSFGEGMPSKVKLVELSFGDASMYRLLSGAAHGEPWATMIVSLRRVPGKLAVTQHLDPDAVSYLVGACMTWLGQATWNYFALNGWDLQDLAQLLEGQYQRAGISPRLWFWR